MYLSKLDVIKFKSNLIGTAKLYRYSLSLLIPMLIADALINGLENTFFAACLIIGYIPVLIIKVLFFTYINNLAYRRISKGLIWAFLSSIVLNSALAILSFVEPPIVTFSKYAMYTSFFTILLWFIYFELPIKLGR
jgi:hypothetical protein